MWVTVIKKFVDKYTGETYIPGRKLNLKRERIEEILQTGQLIALESDNDKNNKEISG